MNGREREKKRNARRTATAVFVATLILCGAFLMMFTSGDSFGRYTATESVHGTFAEDITWELIYQNSSVTSIVLSEPAYHLEDDVTADITVAEGSEVTLCLNGHILNGTGNGSVITVPSGSTLHLCDCNSTNGIHYFTVEESVDGETGLGKIIDKSDSGDDEDDYVSGGVVTGGKAGDGGGIFIQYGGKVTMNSGTIFGNCATYDGNEFTGRGGGVCVLGSFEMTGGRIEHNTSEKDGAGVYVYDGANLDSSHVYSESDGTFLMDGGTVSKNEDGTVDESYYKNGPQICFNRDTYEGVGYGGAGVYLESGTLEMNGGWIYDNQTSGYGGAVFIYGVESAATFTMNGGKLSDNQTVSNNAGGAVYMYGENAVFTADGAEISGNTAHSSGGGVHIYKGTFEMTDTEITDNTANASSSGAGGGGVFVDQPEAVFIMNSGSISGNISAKDGGGVKVDYGKFTMKGGTMENNEANGGSGGGVYICYSGAKFELSGGELNGNFSTGGGAGVYVNDTGSSFVMTGGSIVNHDNGHNKSGGTTDNSGGGVYLKNGSFEMSGGEIAYNSTRWGGAGVYIYRTSSGDEVGMFTMSGGDIHDNSNINGSGPGVFVYQGSFVMSGGYVRDNYAPSLGGGVYVDTADASFAFIGGEISGNSADQDGGGVYVDKGKITISGGSVVSNTAKGGGGGVFLGQSATFAMTGGYISLNTASGNGGGVYVNSNSSFTMSGGTIGGFEVEDGERTGLGNTGTNGGGVYVYSGTFSLSGGGEVCYNSATNLCGGVYFYSSTSFSYYHGNVYNNDPDNVFASTVVELGCSYPYPDADNIRELVAWDWDERTGKSTENADGTFSAETGGTVHVTVYCVCGKKIDEGDVSYAVYQNENTTGIVEDSKFVWYLKTEDFKPNPNLAGSLELDENGNPNYEYAVYSGVYRETDASDDFQFFVPTYGEDNIPISGQDVLPGVTKGETIIYSTGLDEEKVDAGEDNDLFVVTADVDLNYSGGRANNLESYIIGAHPLSFTDMRGDTRTPDTGLVMTSDIYYGESCDDFITITAYDDIYLYVYLQLTNVSYNSNRKGYITYSVNGGEPQFIDRMSTSDRWSVVVLEIELHSGDTLTIGAKNLDDQERTARLWFFGAEAYAVYGAGISESEKDEDKVTSVTLKEGDEDISSSEITVTVGETITIEANAYMTDENGDNTLYTGTSFSWSADSYLYVAYDTEGGTLTLTGMAPSDVGTTITVKIGSVSAYLTVTVVADENDNREWREVVIVDFTEGFDNYFEEGHDGVILPAGHNDDPIEIKDKDGKDTGFSAIGKEDDSTAIEIGKSTTVDENGNTVVGKTYLKFNGSASTTKGVISYYLKAGEYKIEIEYYNANAGRWPVVMDYNGVKLGDDVYDSQKTTADGSLHTRIIYFTLDEDMYIYIGSDNSGLYVTYIAVYKLPGYEVDVALSEVRSEETWTLTDATIESIVGDSIEIKVDVSIEYDGSDYEGGYTFEVVSEDEEVATVPDSSDEYDDTFTVTAKGRGVTVVKINVYAKGDEEGAEGTLIKTVELTVVVRKDAYDTVEVSYFVPDAVDDEALESVIAKDRDIEDNYLFTVTNGTAHEMGYTTGEIFGNIAYIDMYGNPVYPNQAIYTERNIEDSSDILRFTAKDDIYLYVYVALADTKFGSDRAGNVIYYYICDSDGNYAKDEYGNIIYDGSYTVSSLADMWTIAVHLGKGETLVIGYTAASGTNSTLYFFGAEARTCAEDDSVSLGNVTVGGGLKDENGNGKIILTIVDGENYGGGEGASSDKGTITVESSYTINAMILNEDIAELSENQTGGWTVTPKGKGVTYVVFYVLSSDGFVIAMEKVEVVVELVTIDVIADGVKIESDEDVLELTVGSSGTIDVEITVSVDGVPASDYSVSVKIVKENDEEDESVAEFECDEDTGEWTGGVKGVKVGTATVVITVSSEDGNKVAEKKVTVVVTAAEEGDGTATP